MARDSGDDECAIHLAAGIGMKKNVSCEGGGEINKKVTQLSAAVWLEQKANLSRAQHKGITLECAEAIVKDKIKRSISMFAKLFQNLRFGGNKTVWHMRVEFKAFKAGRNSQELFEEIEKFANADRLVVGVCPKVDLHSV